MVAGSRTIGTLEGLERVTPVAVDLAAPGGPASLVAHAVEEFGGEAGGEEGHGVGAQRVAEEERAVAFPGRQVVAQDPFEVAGGGVGLPRGVEVDLRVDPDDGDPLLGRQHPRDLAVDAGPAAVAGKDYGEELAALRRQLEERQVPGPGRTDGVGGGRGGLEDESGERRERESGGDRPPARRGPEITVRFRGEPVHAPGVGRRWWRRFSRRLSARSRRIA